MARMRELVHHLRCDTIEAFMRELSPSHPRYDRRLHNPFALLFRGISDASYPLVPSSLRRGVMAEWAAVSDVTDPVEQVDLEVRLLADFLWAADASGLALPEDSQQLRSAMAQWLFRRENQGRSSIVGWPPDELLSLIALAQHYGLPTRLLDWTLEPTTAAYFAAVGAASAAKTSGRFAVWVLDLARFRYEEYETNLKEVMIVAAPASGNPNLKAQSGVFTLHRPPVVDFDGDVDRRALEDIAFSLLRGKRRTADGPLFLKLSLPSRLAIHVVRELAKTGVSASRLFPGFGGVVQSLRDRGIWDPIRHHLHWPVTSIWRRGDW